MTGHPAITDISINNIGNYTVSKTNDVTLTICLHSPGTSIYESYDFLTRTQYITSSRSEGGVQAIPFSQIDSKVLSFLHDTLVKLGGKPPALVDLAEESWARIGNTGIAQTTTCPDINHKLTNVFNFVSRQMVTLTENLSTRAESSATPVSFDDLPDSVLTEALTKFAEMGGKTDETFVLKGKSSLQKNKLG